MDAFWVRFLPRYPGRKAHLLPDIFSLRFSELALLQSPNFSVDLSVESYI
jgi:hypothetical protein